MRKFVTTNSISNQESKKKPTAQKPKPDLRMRARIDFGETPEHSRMTESPRDSHPALAHPANMDEYTPPGARTYREWPPSFVEMRQVEEGISAPLGQSTIDTPHELTRGLEQLKCGLLWPSCIGESKHWSIGKSIPFKCAFDA